MHLLVLLTLLQLPPAPAPVLAPAGAPPPVRLSREELAAGKVDSGQAEATGGVYAHFVVPAPVPQVYAVLADDAAMSRWIPHLRRVQVLQEGSPCKEVSFSVAVLLGQVDYRLHRCRDGSRLWWSLAGGDRFRSVDGAYALEPFGEGATLVHYWSRVVPAGPIPRGLFDRVAQGGLGALVDGLRAEVARRKALPPGDAGREGPAR